MPDFWARYKHYDPTVEGFGSAAEWAELADVLANGFSHKGASNKGRILNPKIEAKKINPDLEILLLDKLPTTIEDLKTAFRNVLFIYHPDYNGSDEATRNAIEAYQRLLHHYK